MSTFRMDNLPSLRRQQLLSEFAGLKQACPEGVFMSLNPGDAALWTGVIFVREGPYSPAILRFQISFPDSYPQLPPLVTFSTDIFHPLITPLTTYMYTTDIQDNGTVSATDEERLPPGGFSLRHGFPEWFGRGRRHASSTRQHSDSINPDTVTTHEEQADTNSTANKPSLEDEPTYMRTNKKHISSYEVLRYIRSTFDNEATLDSIPLAAAGNPGAWHAWRAHQRAIGKLPEEKPTEVAEKPEVETEGAETRSTEAPSVVQTPTATARQQEEWNWDGVWDDRVKKGIATSLSESVLYGASNSADDMIRFLNMDESEVKSVKDNLHRTLGNV